MIKQLIMPDEIFYFRESDVPPNVANIKTVFWWKSTIRGLSERAPKEESCLKSYSEAVKRGMSQPFVTLKKSQEHSVWTGSAKQYLPMSAIYLTGSPKICEITAFHGNVA